MAWRLVCRRCGYRHPEEEYTPRCPVCGAPLEVEGRLPRPPSPLLGEGGTPLVEADGRLYKLEYTNPTGSFKDRGVSYSLWLAERLGYRCVVEDSSGNTGLSVAAYAARLGLKARIHVPRGAGRGKLNLIRLLGAELVVHESREAASRAALRDSQDCFYVAHLYSPIFLAGMETIAEEIPVDIVGRMPIFVPASSGTLLLGLFRGLRRLGVEPEIIAVQSPEAASLAGRVPVLARDGERGRLLDALVVRDPPRLEEMARAASGVVAVGDEPARRALRRLYSKGFIVEPSSSVVEAAADLLGAGRALLVLTGSGLKYAESLVVEE